MIERHHYGGEGEQHDYHLCNFNVSHETLGRRRIQSQRLESFPKGKTSSTCRNTSRETVLHLESRGSNGDTHGEAHIDESMKTAKG